MYARIVGGAAMPMTFQPISYEELNSKQKESFNFQKVSAVLADLGFVTIRMSSDWGGADFIAQHKDGKFLKVQLKSRLTFSKKYLGKDKGLYICFGEREPDRWYLYPHDEMLKQNLDNGYIGKKFWNEHEDYSNPKPSKEQRVLLDPYQLKPEMALSL
jgi:hypothetical protein